MLVLLIEYLIKFQMKFSVFSCLVFRAIGSLLTALLILLCMCPLVITYLRRYSFGQIIRKDGPISHFNKHNTPTMGGIIILVAIVISVLLWTCLFNPYVWCVLIVLVGYGIIGFVDDYRKIVYGNSRGLIPVWKYFWMSLIALITIFILNILDDGTLNIKLAIPFFKDVILQWGLLYILLVYFVIVGSGNAVNITDGLDGLAIMPIILVALGFTLISLISGDIHFADYLHISYLRYANDLAIFSTSIIGAGLGFLYFNAYPAQIFMGDVGSLALGGALGIIAVLLHQEFFLLIMGGIFVIEALSVILQVSFFKLFRQRIFLMAPIHHHYELKGCSEPKVIIRFWIISLILLLISLVALKVR